MSRLADEHDAVNLDIRSPQDDAGEYVRCNILDGPSVARAFEGATAVVHAAALPGPSFGTPEELSTVNANGTAEVARAALEAGVQRFIYISSESVLGIVFSKGEQRPRYLPIDEGHPTFPCEPYGESKFVAETILEHQIGSTLPLVILRPPWIWVPSEYDRYRTLVENPDEWSNGLWAYVHGDDVAEAIARALVARLPTGTHIAYICAPDNGTVYPTAGLVEKHYHDLTLPDGFPEYGSLISSDTLKALTGFRPAMRWREFLTA
jgi:nucleoside-diphosphate-sugar epimerase